MGLIEDQNFVSVEAVHYASDGIVTLDLSDKRELKLHAGVWADLGQPRDNPLTVEQLGTL